MQRKDEEEKFFHKLIKFNSLNTSRNNVTFRSTESKKVTLVDKIILNVIHKFRYCSLFKIENLTSNKIGEWSQPETLSDLLVVKFAWSQHVSQISQENSRTRDVAFNIYRFISYHTIISYCTTTVTQHIIPKPYDNLILGDTLCSLRNSKKWQKKCHMLEFRTPWSHSKSQKSFFH